MYTVPASLFWVYSPAGPQGCHNKHALMLHQPLSCPGLLILGRYDWTLPSLSVMVHQRTSSLSFDRVLSSEDNRSLKPQTENIQLALRGTMQVQVGHGAHNCGSIPFQTGHWTLLCSVYNLILPNQRFCNVPLYDDHECGSFSPPHGEAYYIERSLYENVHQLSFEEQNWKRNHKL